MLFIYRGRKLDIDDKLMEGYKYYVGLVLVEEDANVYIHNRFVGKTDDPLAASDALPDEDIIGIIEKSLIREIKARTGPQKFRELFPKY